MGKKGQQCHFNGAAWFDRQVHIRTRTALTERGSTASSRSLEYKTEYKQQIKLFRAERAEVKKRKHEKHLARIEKKLAAKRANA